MKIITERPFFSQESRTQTLHFYIIYLVQVNIYTKQNKSFRRT